MNFNPTSGLGVLQGEIESLRTVLARKAEIYEISTLNSRLDDLERTMFNLRSELVSIWTKLQQLETSQQT